jgi:hypothetical protein
MASQCRRLGITLGEWTFALMCQLTNMMRAVPVDFLPCARSETLDDLERKD